ncbi:MAG: hypothetical protein AB7S36_13230, partial [Planctomycetota bacterium]
GQQIASGAKDVLIITPNTKEAQDLQRGLFELDHDGFEPIAAGATVDEKLKTDIIRIYGNPTGDPIKVLWPKEENIIHPAEMPSLTLLKQDKQAGENVLQVQTVWFFAGWVSFGAGITSGLLLLLWVFLTLRSRQGAAATPAAA